MFTSQSCSHYFIERRGTPEKPVPDLVLTADGVAVVTYEDLDFSGRTFRILASPFQKSCYAFGLVEPEQVPDILRILRKATPGLTQLVFPMARSGRKVVNYYGDFEKENRQAFQGFLAEQGFTLEEFLLDPRLLVIIDGRDDILGELIRNRLFDMENIAMLVDLMDPTLIEKYQTP